MKNYLKIVKIDENSITPKYLQIKNSILSGSESRQLKKDDILSSINDFSYGLETSRNTVEKAYGIHKLKKALKIGIADMLLIDDTLFAGGNDHPANITGADCIQIWDPDENKKVIEAIIAYSDTKHKRAKA